MDFMENKRKSNFTRKIILAASITALFIFMIKRPAAINGSTKFSQHEAGVTHVLVTGGAGYIGSHAVLRLLKDSYRITILDNLSRGNMGAVKVLQGLYPEPGRLQFIYADLGDAEAVSITVSLCFALPALIPYSSPCDLISSLPIDCCSMKFFLSFL
ncbi:UNVERIFIED_CONTAM: putative UDP-arabinose 4-epimerase 3 [Sesamum angustifolium]|uniref:UDP-arabinose 4-epimerase 3 n=1 Tax=Sesamum angustifolium TaxID=2727405 RepID=A0AAW2J6Z1_9LAMI